MFWFIGIVYIIINIIIAYYMKNAAYAKGYDNNAHAWALCFWFGLPGWLYVISLPDLVARQNQKIIIDLLANNKQEQIPETNYDDLPDI